MRTVRCSRNLLEGVCLPRGEGCVCSGGGMCLPIGGVCLWGVFPGDVCPGGCLAETPRADTPRADTNLWTEWQKLVKTLPCRNYVADGNNVIQEETSRFGRLSDVLSENVIFTLQFNNIKASSSLSVGEGWDKNTIGWKWHFERNMWQFRM